MRVRRGLLLPILLSLVVGAATALAADSGGSGRGTPPDGFRAPSRDALEQHRQRMEARNTPAAREDRRRSREAFKALAREEALDVARQKFRDVVATPITNLLPLGRGERIKEYTGDFGAIVDQGDHNVVVSSTLPLRTRNEAGDKAPVDLHLTERGGSLEPRNAITRIGLSRSARTGVEFEASGIRASFGGADPEAEGATVVEDRVFYPNVARDTDWLVKPVPAGVETFTVLRSEDSPETQVLDLDLPRGAHLRKGTTGDFRSMHGVVPPQAPVEVVRGNDVIATISPPRAWDADQQDVPVAYAVHGDDIRMTTEHRGRDLRYPIMVDPYLVEDFQHWIHNPNVDFDGWEPAWRNWPWGFNQQNGYVGKRGLHVWADAHFAYNVQDYGEWFWRARGTSNIERVDLHYVDHYMAGTCVGVGIWSTPNNGWAGPPVSNCPWTGAPWRGAYVRSDATTHGPGQHVSAHLMMQWTGSRGGQVGYLYFGGAAIHNADSTPPVIEDASVIDYKAGDSPTGRPSHWMRYESRRVRMHAKDSGLGVKQVHLLLPRPDGSLANYPMDRGCADQRRPCDEDLSIPDPAPGTYKYGPYPQFGEYYYHSNDLPEGESTLGVLAYDPTYNHSGRQWRVKVDRTRPEHDLIEGSLAPSSGWTGAASPSLTVGLRDSNPNGGQVSGVKYSKIEFDPGSGPSETKDNKRADDTIAPCDAQTGCKPTLSPHTLSWPDVSDGAHNVRVSAEDAAGNPVERTWGVKVDRTKPSVSVAWDPDISGGRLWEDEYKATITATDALSGIQRAELLVDGVRLRNDHVFERSSACDGCGLTHTFTLRTEDVPPGEHTVSIKTEDFAGNKSTPQTWAVVHQPGGGQQDHFGFDNFGGDEALALKVNRASGNLLIESHDVADVEMNVDRYYNSEWSGRGGSFGRGWSASTGSDIRLREAADGSIVFYGPSLYAIRFTRAANGTYVSPARFSGSLTRRGDGVFVVQDRIRGDMFEFPSATSRLAAITDEADDRVAVGYAADGAIDRLVNPDEEGDDRITNFATTDQRVTRITDPDDEVGHSYSYKAAGLLATSTSRGGAATTYDYDGAGRLNALTLPSGVRFTITYATDAASRVATVTRYAAGSPVGETTTYSYAAGQTTVTRPTGAAVYRYDHTLQVYTPDSTPPEVYEPFGYSPEGTITDGEHVGGNTTAEIPAVVDDAASGVRRVWLERVGVGTIEERTTSCASLPGEVGFVSVCPPRYESTFTISTASLPEGANTFRLNATDGAGNTGPYPTFDLLVDRTAPSTPIDLRMSDFDASTGQASVSWDLAGDDPDLPTGHAGSGIARIEYRYRNGVAPFTPWTIASDEEETITLSGVAQGNMVTVEARVVDNAENVSPVASANLSVVDPPVEPDEFGSVPAGSGEIAVTVETEVPRTDGTTATYPAGHTQVSLRHVATGQKAVRLTGNETGLVRFTNLEPGTYEMSPIDSEFEPRTISVAAGQTKSETTRMKLNSAQYTSTKAEEKFCDKELDKCLLFYADAKKAERFSEINFTEPERGSEGTKTNGFKHPFWVAMMVNSLQHASYGSRAWINAYRFAKAHEYNSRRGDIDDRRNTKMDFHNNRLGYRTGKRHASEHNDEWFCNHMRHRVAVGRLRKHRRGSTRWRRKPPRAKIVWIRVFHKNTGEKPRMLYPTPCGRN